MYNIPKKYQAKSPEELIRSFDNSIGRHLSLFISASRKYSGNYHASHATMASLIGVEERQSQRNSKIFSLLGIVLTLPRWKCTTIDGVKTYRSLTNKYVLNKKIFKGNFWTQLSKLRPDLEPKPKHDTLLVDFDIINLQRLTNSSNLTTKEQRLSTSRQVTTMPESPPGTLGDLLVSLGARDPDAFFKKGERNEV